MTETLDKHDIDKTSCGIAGQVNALWFSLAARAANFDRLSLARTEPIYHQVTSARSITRPSRQRDVRLDGSNQYLDYETIRRLTDNTLRSYAHELLHFLRWWESVYHTDAVTEDSLTESTL